MNQKPPTPDSSSSPLQAEDLWYQPALFRPTGTMDGIDLFTLEPPRAVPIIHPQPGQVIEGILLAAQVPWQDKHYMVVGTSSGEVAARTDVILGTDFPTPTEVRLKGVTVGNERIPDTPAWEVYSLFPLGNDVWVPASNQHLELRTLPADQWVAEIQSGLVPGFRTQLQRDETECQKLVTERARINPLAPQSLDATTALLFAKRLTFGQAYQEAYVAAHRPETDSPEHHRARAEWESFEKLAQSPEHRGHLQSAAEALLQEDTRLGKAIAENQINIGVLHDSLQETGDLIKHLKRLGKTKVTLEQSTIREWRQRLLPIFVTAESPRLSVKRGSKVRL